jgi:polyketide biosynthesis enoyl-CoA hydratase PksH
VPDVDQWETMRVDARRDVLRVVLDRPERQNSINGALLADLHRVLDHAERSPDVRVVVIEGTGGVFCSGMDFADASRDSEDVAAHGAEEFFGLLHRISTVDRVVVSVVDGRVAGGGVGIVAASDFVYASARSSFGLPEALWGLLPCCVLPFLIRRVGFQPAYAMTLSTLPVSASQGERMRLVDEVTDDAGPALRRLVGRLTKVDGVTVGDAKRYLGRMWLPVEQLRDTAIAEFSRLLSAPVVQQRIADFANHQRLPWESR